MKGILSAWMFAVLVVTAPARAKSPIEGAWEMHYVPPAFMEDASPLGMANDKYYFASDGSMMVLMPEQAAPTDESQIGRYEYRQGKLTLYAKDEKSGDIPVSFKGTDTMLFADRMVLRRMDSVDKPIRPRSLQLVEDDEAVARVEPAYDHRTHESLPVEKRMLGAWELVAVRDISRQALAPYGFTNDVFVITPESMAHYSNEYERMDMTPVRIDASEKWMAALEVGFNAWGQLLLTERNRGGVMILTRLRHDPGAPPPNLRRKIVSITLSD